MRGVIHIIGAEIVRDEIKRTDPRDAFRLYRLNEALEHALAAEAHTKKAAELLATTRTAEGPANRSGRLEGRWRSL